MERIENFKLAVKEIFEDKEIVTDCNNPLLFLYSLDGLCTKEAKEVMIGEIIINTGSCFGKMLRAAVLVEQLFPNHILYSGLVCENFFRDMLLSRRFETKYWEDENYIKEILQYEESSMIILDKEGNQFDPLFKKISYTPEMSSHSSVECYGLWEGLHAFYLVTLLLEARKNVGINQYCLLLFKINSLYSKNILVKKTWANVHCLIDRKDKSIQFASETISKYKSVKELFFLWEITEDQIYKDKIIEGYNIKMFNYFDNLYVKPLDLTLVMRKAYDSLSEVEKHEFLKQQRKPIKIFEDKAENYCSPYISQSV
ncbi:MAG: hypothetical protein WCI91_03570 [Candidatus Nomurabacteria bacterium]